MTQLQKARRVTVAVTIGGHDATSILAPYLLDFTYTDHIDGKADDVQLKLHDREGLWQGDWQPEKGMEVVASIVVENWFAKGQSLSLACGTFTIDEVEFAGPPDTVTIKAVSASLTGALRDTGKTRAFENSSLMIIAEQFAKENELTLYYEGDVHPFRRQDQRSESDFNFLHRLAKEHGMFLKVHDKKLVINDAEQIEQAASMITIARQEKSGNAPNQPVTCCAKSYTFKASSSGTAYTHAKVAYTDPTKGQTHTATVPATNKDGAASKPLLIDARVESPAKAITVGKAALQRQNAKEITASLELMGNPALVSGITINLPDFGNFSGQYLIDKASHKITGGGGYSTSLELHKSRAASPRVTATSKPISAGSSHV